MLTLRPKPLILALLLGLFLAKPFAQETLNTVQRELDRVEKEIEREKEMHKTERKRAADFEGDKAAKLRALQEQTRLTQGRIDSLKRGVDRARQQKASFRNQVALYQGKEREFGKALAQAIRDEAGRVSRDFPYQREKRAADLGDLANALESGLVSAEDGLGRFFTLLQTALDFAYDTEVYQGSYQATDGSNHQGNYVRMGAALLAFAGEDGKTVAYLAKVPNADSGYAWKDKDLDQAVKEDVFAAVKVAQGKLAPQLVRLPFDAPPVKEGAK